jgi:GT2 family glycosyltransferase
MSHRSSRSRVSVIIVNWNGFEDTVICLDSLKKITPHNTDLEVIVVDNGSTNESVEVISKKHSWVTIIETGKNLGFTGGNNVGVSHALSKGADFVWLLNNDTIVAPDVLSFLKVFDDPKVGACGSKIYFAPGHEYHVDRYTKDERGKVIWYAGGKVDWHNMYASHRGVDEVDKGQYDKVEETPFITGCSFIVRADVIKKLGGLDDRYYLYLEDLDWSVRIQKAGFKTVYAPMSTLWHVNAGSSGKPGNPLHEYYFTRNRLIMGFTYAPIRTRIALMREAIRFVFGKSPVRRKAVIDALLGRFGKQYDPKKTTR